MFATAFGVLGTVVANHRADVVKATPTELAGKRSTHPAFIGLMMLSMRIFQAIIANQTAKISFFFSTMDANVWTRLIPFK